MKSLSPQIYLLSKRNNSLWIKNLLQSVIRSPCCHHYLPGFRDTPDGQEECYCPQFALRGDPWVYICHLLWQNWHPDHQSDVCVQGERTRIDLTLWLEQKYVNLTSGYVSIMWLYLWKSLSSLMMRFKLRLCALSGPEDDEKFVTYQSLQLCSFPFFHILNVSFSLHFSTQTEYWSGCSSQSAANQLSCVTDLVFLCLLSIYSTSLAHLSLLCKSNLCWRTHSIQIGQSIN